ncbi:SesA protein [Tricladium varicosporioides]|nr:SesA protein [Hymenoscyphus varicosporioides]
MSGIEVIGMIAAVIGIIDGASKLYDSISNSRKLPEAFREVAQRLPLVRDTLQTTEGRLHLQKFDGDKDTYAAIKPTIESCKDRAERLRNILQEVVGQPDDSRLARYRLAVRRLGKESKVEELMRGMLEDVQLLGANQAVKGVGEDKVNEITSAIQALAKVPSSVSDGGGSVFNYQGTGDQINNTGSGTQNINKGKGQQYIGHTISFGV